MTLSTSSRRRSFVAPCLAAAVGLALPATAAVVGLGPELARAATGERPEAVRLTPLPEPGHHEIRTRSGATIEARLWPGSEWVGSPDWWPGSEWREKESAATGELVLIVFDAGDGVSVEPMVQMTRAMGASVVTFELPEKSAKADRARMDAVHAMITWANRQVTESRPGGVHLFGVGRGADLALKVGLDRTDDLRTILLDSPTDIDLLQIANGTMNGKSKASSFAGIQVVRSSSRAVRKASGGLVQLAPDSMTYPKQASLSALAEDGRYQRSVAQALVPPQP